MTRYVMVADLERCVGCQTCTAACRHTNATSPAVQWRKVLDIEAGTFPEVSRTFVPVGCQHCEDPPCMHVCPTTATRKRADGIVTVDYDLCIGCAYCDVACPYQARFKIDQPAPAYDSPTLLEQKTYQAARVGVSQKCTFCSDRIDTGVARGLVPGKDPEATPACVNSCIADALHFGDAQDPASNVSRLLAENTSFRMHEELGTQPNFHYLHDRRHTPATPIRGNMQSNVQGPDIEPKHQAHWDWKAAANFICGGAGAALFALAVAYSRTDVAGGALVLIALGLGVLFLKIGRPLRFLYVLRQPQRSWMSREAWLAGLLFPLGMLYVGTGQRELGVAAAVVALVFLFAQAMILKESRGIPAWRTPYIVPLILLTGLAEGAALLMLFVPFPLWIFVVLRAGAWWAYRKSMVAPTRTLEVLKSCRHWMLWGGLVLPLLSMAMGWSAFAALAVITTGWALKLVLVTRAGYQQGYAIERAGGTLKPGWNLGGSA
jgi:phenylacetyl-CoA:acceptor oxidoreductase 27-kDa subunit